MTHWEGWRQRDFLALPKQGYQQHSGWWDSLAFVPTRRRHDSGYAMFTIVGIGPDGPKERIVDYDVINIYDRDAYYNIDCLWPSGVFRLFYMAHEVTYNYGRVEHRPRTGATV